MEESRLKIPDGYEVAYIEGSDIVLRSVLPKTWDDCYYGSRVQCSNLNIDDLRNLVPIDLVSPMLALCQLLVCRDVWWEKLGWKPDCADMVTKKCVPGGGCARAILGGIRGFN